MSKQNQPTKTVGTTKSQPKAEPARTVEHTGSDVAVAGLLQSDYGPAGALPAGVRPGLLGNNPLGVTQRQMVASRIGHRQGNAQLQQVLHMARQAHPAALPARNAAQFNVARSADDQANDPFRDFGAEEQAAGETETVTSEPASSDTSTPPALPPGSGDAAGEPIAKAAPATEEERTAALTKANASSAQAAQALTQGNDEKDRFQASAQVEKATAQGEIAAAPAVNGTAAMAVNPPAAPALVSQSDRPEQQTDNAQEEATDAASGMAEKAPASAVNDPAFQGVVAATASVASTARAHAPAMQKAKAAQAAAESPASELAGMAQANQVGEMAAAETPGFDAAAFKATLMARIEALTPRNAADVDEFKEQNKAGALKSELRSETAAQKERAQAPLATATGAAPDTGSVAPKPATPLQGEEGRSTAAAVDAGGAAPKPKGAQEVEAPLQEHGATLDAQMVAAGVTEAQLAASNEPAFLAAAESRQEMQADAALAPLAYRQDEQNIIVQAQNAAAATVNAETSAMQATQAATMAVVGGQQQEGKQGDEKARAEVGAKLQAIYSATKGKVDQALASLDSEVDQLFSAGAEAARQSFEAYVDAAMDAYKEERYGGALGWAQWLIDRVFKPTQPEVLAIFRKGRSQYVAAMDGVIDNVVALIGRKLAEAKAEIANGKQEIQAYLGQLPANLQAVGQEAAQAIQGQFDELEQGIDARQSALIERLANQYNEQLQGIETRLEQLRAQNSTLYDLAADRIGGVIDTILEMKGLLQGMLARAADAVDKIIQDPIGFLGNLVAGVKQGLQNFIGNLGQHMEGGFVAWLTGAFAASGIAMPQNWDLPGIFQFVMEVLGLGFDKIMGRLNQLLGIDIMAVYEPVAQVVATYQAEGMAGLVRMGLGKLVGEEHVASLMQVMELFQSLISGNWTNLWALVDEHLTNLNEMVFGQIEEFLTERVFKAGVSWIMGLLNPAGAFVKACRAIYDIFQFFVERGAQVRALVDAVIDSAGAIAAGNVSSAANAVEQALGKGIPVAIGFLSSLLGMGDVSEEVQKIVQRLRAPVEKALDAIFNSGPIQMVAGVVRRILTALTGDVATTGKVHTESEAQAARGLEYLHAEEARIADDGDGIASEEAQKIAQKVVVKFPVFESISAIDGGDSWDYQYVIARQTENGKKPKSRKKSNTLEIKSFGPRPKFSSSTRDEIPITSGQHRRHIVAYETFHERLKQALNGKTIQEADKILRRLRSGKTSKRGDYAPTSLSVAAIIQAGRQYLIDRNNDSDNLWAGSGSQNSSLGSRSRWAKKAAQQAIESGDIAQFRDALLELENTWLDLDPSDEQAAKYINVMVMTIRRLKQQFREKHRVLV